MLDAITAIDLYVLNGLYAYRSLPITLSLIDVTEVGSAIAVFGIGLCIALILAIKYRFAEMTGLIVALGGTAIASSAIKTLIHRARPSEYYQAYIETGYSFPSEHTALATTLCVFLVYLVFRITQSKSIRIITLCIGIILSIAVGFSRLYLGVHYISDVIGGILLGTIMAGIGIVTEQFFENIQSFYHRADTTLAD